MKHATSTAAYEANRAEIKARMQRLEELLLKLDERQQADPQNWGLAGCAAHISEELACIIDDISLTAK